MNLKRGDIYYYDFGEIDGSKQGGIRPAIIMSNNTHLRYSYKSGVVQLVPLTSSMTKANLPVHFKVVTEDGKRCGFGLCEQIVTVNINGNNKLHNYLGMISKESMLLLNKALRIQLGL